MSNSELNQIFLYLPLSVLKKERVLNNGNIFPMVTYCVNNFDDYEELFSSVDVALDIGYRSFECAPIFDQEKHFGTALAELLPKYNLNRNDILINSKIFPKDYGFESTNAAIERSCETLNTPYIDTYLMQWPGGSNLDPEDEENSKLRMETWNELVKLNLKGIIKNIGVSNFNVKHLEALREFSNKIPAVNQVEFHPKFPQLELLNYCRENNILMQSSSLQDTFHALMVSNNTIREVAKSVGKTPTQVLLKWIINKGVAVTTQTKNPKKIRQNFLLYDFVLEKPYMDAINSIDEREKYSRNPICII